MFLLIPINDSGYRPPPIACQSIEDVHSWFLAQSLFLGQGMKVSKEGVFIGSTHYDIVMLDMSKERG